MKKPCVIGFLFILFIALSGIALLAQNSVDDQGDPNDPATNPRANACYAGGSLAGRCNVEWEWVCGWGIIRVEKGLLNRAVLASACQPLMSGQLSTNASQSNRGSSNSNAVSGGGTGNESIFFTNTPEPPPPPTPTYTPSPIIEGGGASGGAIFLTNTPKPTTAVGF